MRLLVLCLLAGCATTSPDIAVTSAPSTTVEIPVPVPCLSEVPEPPQRTPVDPKASVQQLAAAAAADVLRLQAYAEKTHALLLACKGDVQ